MRCTFWIISKYIPVCLCMNHYCWLIRGSFVIELGCPANLVGTPWHFENPVTDWNLAFGMWLRMVGGGWGLLGGSGDGWRMFWGGWVMVGGVWGMVGVVLGWSGGRVVGVVGGGWGWLGEGIFSAILDVSHYPKS